MDVDTLRRNFHVLHSALRDEGYNPLEAISLLANALAPNGHDATEKLSAGLRASLSETAKSVDASGLSVAFQQFMVSEARNGLGQYLTPDPVAELIAAVVASAGASSVLDPFAGSSLLLEHVGRLVPSATLQGIEINPAVAQVARAVGRLSRRNIEVTEADAFMLWVEGKIPPVDAVVTNPPFGAVATRVGADELARAGVPASLLALGALPAELLGLELSVSVLREGGVLAIVLPQSILTNTRYDQYRVDLFERLHPRAVVSLPEETFGPFRGVAKACVLFATKGRGTLPATFPFLRSKSIGYDETGRPTVPSDLPGLELALQEEGRVLPSATVNKAGAFLIPPTIGHFRPEECWRLGDFAEIFTGRTLPRGSHAADGPMALSVGGLSGSFVAWRPRLRSHVPLDDFLRNKRAHLQVGDICLTSAAHKPRYIGLKVDLLDAVPAAGAMATAEVLVIRLKPGAPFLPVQLLFYLRGEAGYRQVQDLVRGSTAHLYPKDMAGLLIPPFDDTGREQLEAAFTEAARHFREYLRFEAQAVELGAESGQVVSADMDA